MFKKVNSGRYVLDSAKANELIAEVKGFLVNDLTGISVNSELYTVTVRQVLSYKISLLVVRYMKEELIKQTFVSIQYAGDITGIASVGWYDNKVVYGVLA